MNRGLPRASLRQWIDQRLGWSTIRELAAHKQVPIHRHSLWYYLGGMTLFCFLVQIVTGILLLLYYRPTAEAAVLYPLWLAKIAYPELLRDVDMAKELKKFYREIMSFSLTDEQVHAVLEGAYTLRFGPVSGNG